MPVRVPMLAAGQLDAALGFSFRLYIDLKDRGVPVGDIVQIQMPDYKMKLYGAAIIVNTKFADRAAGSGPQIPARDAARIPRDHPQPLHRGRWGAAPRREREEGRRGRTAAHGDPRERRDAGGPRQRLRRGRSRAARGVDRPDRAQLHVQVAARRPTPCSTRRSCRRRRNGAPTRACTHKRTDRSAISTCSPLRLSSVPSAALPEMMSASASASLSSGVMNVSFLSLWRMS